MMRRLTPLLLALALAAAAGPAAGERGQILAGSADYEGSATQEGRLDLFFLLSTTLDGQDTGTPWIAIDAAQITAVSYSSRSVDAPVPGPFTPGATPLEPSKRNENSFSDGKARLSAFQPAFEIHAFTLGESLPYEARVNAGGLSSQGPVRMSAGGFGDDANGDQTIEQDGLDSSTFSTLERTGPLVVHKVGGEHADLTLRGDLVLEIFGLTLDLEAREGTATLASGSWRKPVEGAPEPTMAAAYEQHETFVRLFLDDATVSLAMDGGSPRLEWAAAGLAMEPEGPVTFSNSRGRIHMGDQEYAELQDDRFVLPAGNLLAVTPQSDGLAVDISEPDLGTRGTIADVPAPASAALVGAGAILALGIAVGIGVLRRVLRLPQLADVETAIEEGEYRKAARLAGRILSRRPTDESAILARGIALTKAGDNEQAVRELAHHLSHAQASDGALHYVLGLAQLDLGRKEEGRAALREAARLTPSLQAEVGARLGKGFSTPSATTRETNGYA